MLYKLQVSVVTFLVRFIGKRTSIITEASIKDSRDSCHKRAFDHRCAGELKVSLYSSSPLY